MGEDVADIEHAKARTGGDGQDFAGFGLRRAAPGTGSLIEPELGGGQT